MKSLHLKNIFLLFWIVVLADLAGIGLGIPLLHFICKPLLMPALIFAVLSFGIPGTNRTKIIAALIFSFLGDVFLLLENRFPVFFLVGLGCFLLAHIFYIVYFIGQHGPGSMAKKNPILILPVIAYAACLLYLLAPVLGDLKIPVFIYATVISVMLCSTLFLGSKTERRSRPLFIMGAASFVLSDSLLAINKFYHPLPMAAILIMLTYCLAQFLIVKGWFRNSRS